MNKPDYWQLLKITKDDQTYYKIFATWVGGYLDGDRWRMNSGVVGVQEKPYYYDFIGDSGSVYTCLRTEQAYRTSSYSQGVLDNIIERSQEVNAAIEVVPFDKVKDIIKAENWIK